MTDAPSVFDHQRKLTRLLVIVLVLFVAAIAAMVLAVVDGRYVWAPLDPYPVQKVITRNVKVGEDVIVEAEKCNGSDETVTVEGVFQWQSVDPTGTSIVAGRGTREQPPGCLVASRKTGNAYHNPIPELVAQRAVNVCRSRGTPTSWIISGKETPYDGNRAGLARLWRTESFTIECPK